LRPVKQQLLQGATATTDEKQHKKEQVKLALRAMAAAHACACAQRGRSFRHALPKQSFTLALHLHARMRSDIPPKGDSQSGDTAENPMDPRHARASATNAPSAPSRPTSAPLLRSNPPNPPGDVECAAAKAGERPGPADVSALSEPRGQAAAPSGAASPGRGVHSCAQRGKVGCASACTHGVFRPSGPQLPGSLERCRTQTCRLGTRGRGSSLQGSCRRPSLPLRRCPSWRLARTTLVRERLAREDGAWQARRASPAQQQGRGPAAIPCWSAATGGPTFAELVSVSHFTTRRLWQRDDVLVFPANMPQRIHILTVAAAIRQP
jgi:hypothetical protein